MTDETRSINVAHYWRPSPRHHWRNGSTTVNVTERVDSPLPVVRRRDPRDPPDYEYADVPYDWEVWTPPRTTRILPGLPEWPSGARGSRS